MDEMNNTMNEVMDTAETTTDLVAPEAENLVPVEDSNENESSGALGAMVLVGAIALAGYAVGKVGEKVVRKIGPSIKNRFDVIKSRKTKKVGKSDEPIEVEAEEVEPENESQ